MLTIRMKRIGKKNRPFYHIIISEKLKSIKGKYIEKLGYFNPIKKNECKVNIEKIKHWVKKGADVSIKVKHLIKKMQKSNLV